MPTFGDGVVDVNLSTVGEEEMAIDFSERLNAHLDRKDGNDTNFDKALDMSYAANQQFREAVAGRIAMESGSGRTRAETNAPLSTSAHAYPPNVTSGS